MQTRGCVSNAYRLEITLSLFLVLTKMEPEFSQTSHLSSRIDMLFHQKTVIETAQRRDDMTCRERDNLHRHRSHSFLMALLTGPTPPPKVRSYILPEPKSHTLSRKNQRQKRNNDISGEKKNAEKIIPVVNLQMEMATPVNLER